MPAGERTPSGTLARVAARLRARWQRTLARLAPLGGASQGNRVAVYNDGDAAFTAILLAIASARRQVWFEVYILEPDALGQRVIEALAEAARRGCEVILLYDSFGSPRIGDSFLAPLRAAGGRAVAFNPVWTWRPRLPPHIRDHRKIVIVDGEVAFCGGMNVTADYAGLRLGTGRFRDTVARIEGPASRDLAAVLARSLEETTGEKIQPSIDPTPRPDGVYVQVLASNARRNLRSIQRAFRQALQRASLRCYLTTPYFVPPSRLKRALFRAARRGVDVRVLTAGESDVPTVRAASEHLYGRYLQHGVRVYEMFGKTLHAKTATVDGLWAMVGSFNLDRWSDRRNLEVSVTVLDPVVAREMEEHFRADLAQSREVTLETWKRRSLWRRLWGWIAYQILRW